jgi:hypothetical protein
MMNSQATPTGGYMITKKKRAVLKDQKPKNCVLAGTALWYMKCE